MLAQINLQIAYVIPVCSMTIGLLVFILGYKRYVINPIQKKMAIDTLKLIGRKAVYKPLDAFKQSNGGTKA
jgi:hypothetical protein